MDLSHFYDVFKVFDIENNSDILNDPIFNPKPKDINVNFEVEGLNQNKINDLIVKFIEQTKDRDINSFTDEEKEFIYKYEGSGGLKQQGAKDRGVLTEFYTPEILSMVLLKGKF